MQPWLFKSWLRRGQWELNKFPDLPDLAHYFDDPSCLVFDTRKDFRVNIEHIISETPRERFPEPYASMEDFALPVNPGRVSFHSSNIDHEMMGLRSAD
jgi:hypothetical protein